MAAGDNTAQRQNVASRTVAAVTDLMDALYQLQKLKDQVTAFTAPFADTDFAAPNNANVQLTAALLTTFFNTTLPNLNTAVAANNNKTTLLQMRGG